VHRAIPGIAVILHVIGKLPPKIGIHAALSTAPAARNASQANASEPNASGQIAATITRPRFIKLAPIRHAVVLKLGIRPKSKEVKRAAVMSQIAHRMVQDAASPWKS
jgi:hypothetical protein